MALRYNGANNNIRNQLQYIKVLQHNVQHWSRARSIELGNFYRKENPGVILLNSTGMTDRDRITIYNYNVTSRNLLNEAHAGVAIAVRKDLQYRIVDDFNDDILGAQLETTRGPVMILTNYSPPRRNYIPTAEIENKLQKNMPVYFVGDLNASLPAMGYGNYNNNGREIHRLIQQNKIIHMGPDFKTLVHRNGRPDIVFSNRNAYLNYAVERGGLTSSDHFPVVLKLSTRPIVKNVEATRSLKRTNWELFKGKLETKIEQIFDMDEIRSRRNIDAEAMENMYRQWYEVIEHTLNETSPKVNISYYLHARDSDYLRLLEMNYRNLTNRPIWTRHDIEILKNIQQQIREENLRLFREEWEKKVEGLNRIHKDSSKFWGGVKRLIGSSKEKQEYILHPVRRNTKVFEPEEKEEIYRGIWTNIFSIPPEDNAYFDPENEERVTRYLRENEEAVDHHQYADLSRLDPDSYLTAPFKTTDIEHVINKFKNKAPGKSGVNKKILSNLPRKATECYTLLTNLAFSMGYYPTIYKNGMIVFANKPGKDPRYAENYRPITLLEVPGKVMERLVNDRVSSFFEMNNLYNQNQYGFRREKGTDSAIAVAYETIALTQQKRHFCNIVCRDVAKAFDRVWIEGLKYKLLHTELPALLKKVLCSFATNRTAQIKIEKYVGPKFQLRAGVPQGSILSPTLFIFYTHDVPPPAIQTDMDVIFADDITQVIIHEGNREEAAIQTEREVVRVNNYEKLWKIKTNKNKFRMITASRTHPAPISIDDENLPFNENVNILGLTLKRTGTLSHIVSKIGHAKSQLLKLRRFYKIKPELMIRLYLTLIRPIMEYPIIPIALSSKNNIRKMQVVQNRALRQAVKGTDDNHLTIKEIHEKYGIEAVNVRLSTRLAKLWQKIERTQPDLHQRTMDANDNGLRDHAWWPRAGRVAALDPPEPSYTTYE